MSYSNNIPQPNDFLDQSQVDLLANFTVLDSNYLINHYTFSDTTPNKGKHRYVTMPQQPAGTTPATALGDGNVFTLLGLGLDNSNKQTQLMYTSDNGGQGYQLSRCIDSKINEFSKNTNYPQVPPVANQFGGWSFLPGAMLFQYGRVAGSSANTTPVKFPVPFTVGAYSITLTPERLAANPGDSAFTAILTGSLSLTGFTIANIGSHSMNNWYWMAVGQ